MAASLVAAVSSGTLAPTPASEAVGGVQADSAVARLVSRVSARRIREHVEALASGPRADRASRAAAADYITAALESWGYPVRRQPVRSSENVIATLRGVRYPDRTVVLGAHYDSVARAPGADDNASGVAGLLEIARALRRQSYPESIELVAFALEEVGLFGSAAHAGAAAAELLPITGVIGLDMIGYTCAGDCQVPWTDERGCVDVSEPVSRVGDWLGLLANADSSSLLARFVDAAARHVPELPVETAVVRGVGRCSPDTRLADQASYWDAGFEGLLAEDGADLRNPHYHSRTDTSETLDYDFARSVTQAALATAVELASPEPPCAPEPLPACRPSARPSSSKLLIRDADGRGRDALDFLWSRGGFTGALPDWDDPSADDLALCVYAGPGPADPGGPTRAARQAGALVMTATAPGGTCGSEPCWRRRRGGFLYRDPNTTPDGILAVELQAGAAAGMRWKGEAGYLRLPDLPLALPVLVQVRAESGSCWEEQFDAAGVRRNTSRAFQADVTG